MPTSGDKTARYGAPKYQTSDVDHPALMVLMLLPTQAKTGLEWVAREFTAYFLSDAMSITKRYFTSLLSRRS